MTDSWDIEARRSEVERILDEMGAEAVDGLDEWDGDDLEDLRKILDDDQFEALMDQLSDDLLEQ